MVNLIEAIILGIIQGITEWLPISSSGHLVLAQKLLGLDEPVVFDVVLHFGSLLVIILVFWKDLIQLAKGILQKDKKSLQFLLYIIIGTIPIALIGFFLNDLVKSAFESTTVVGISLLITSVLLFLSKYPKKKTDNLKPKNVLIVGLAQSLAILPGISRSGSTIATGLMLGIKKKDIAKFSFILAIPAILGANLLEISSIGQVSNVTNLAVATIVTVITGYFSLKLLLRIIQKDQFRYFGWYCLVVGIAVLAVSL